jgi:hypothetical protein
VCFGEANRVPTLVFHSVCPEKVKWLTWSLDGSAVVKQMLKKKEKLAESEAAQEAAAARCDKEKEQHMAETVGGNDGDKVAEDSAVDVDAPAADLCLCDENTGEENAGKEHTGENAGEGNAQPKTPPTGKAEEPSGDTPRRGQKKKEAAKGKGKAKAKGKSSPKKAKAKAKGKATTKPKSVGKASLGTDSEPFETTIAQGYPIN